MESVVPLNNLVQVKLALQKHSNSRADTTFRETEVGKLLEYNREERSSEVSKLQKRRGDRDSQIEAQRLLEVGANDKSPLTFNIADEIQISVAEALKEEEEEKKKDKQAGSAAGIMARVLAAARKRF